MNQVKKYRDRLGLNQTELAGIAKLTQAAICQYEQQVRQPNGRSLVQLSEALQVSPAELLGNAPQGEQALDELDLIAISRVRAILDWWQANSDAVSKLEALSIRKYGNSENPLIVLSEKLKAP